MKEPIKAWKVAWWLRWYAQCKPFVLSRLALLCARKNMEYGATLLSQQEEEINALRSANEDISNKLKIARGIIEMQQRGGVIAGIDFSEGYDMQIMSKCRICKYCWFCSHDRHFGNECAEESSFLIDIGRVQSVFGYECFTISQDYIRHETLAGVEADENHVQIKTKDAEGSISSINALNIGRVLFFSEEEAEKYKSENGGELHGTDG